MPEPWTYRAKHCCFNSVRSANSVINSSKFHRQVELAHCPFGPCVPFPAPDNVIWCQKNLFTISNRSRILRLLISLQFLSYMSEGGRCIHPVFWSVNTQYHFFYTPLKSALGADLRECRLQRCYRSFLFLDDTLAGYPASHKQAKNPQKPLFSVFTLRCTGSTGSRSLSMAGFPVCLELIPCRLRCDHRFAKGI